MIAASRFNDALSAESGVGLRVEAVAAAVGRGNAISEVCWDCDRAVCGHTRGARHVGEEVAVVVVDLLG
jgi:hypothetical protein